MPTPTGTIVINQPNPALGDTVTFTVTVTKKYDCVGHQGCARVLVQAFQNGELVYGEAGSIEQARGSGDDPLGYSGFLLGGGGSTWKDRGGPADCVATLFRFDNSGGQQFVPIATTSFAAGA